MAAMAVVAAAVVVVTSAIAAAAAAAATVTTATTAAMATFQLSHSFFLVIYFTDRIFSAAVVGCWQQLTRIWL